MWDQLNSSDTAGTVVMADAELKPLLTWFNRGAGLFRVPYLSAVPLLEEELCETGRIASGQQILLD